MSLKNKKIGFLGCGNMGSAILKGLIEKRLVSSGRLFVADQKNDKLKQIVKKFHVKALTSNKDLARLADIIILAVKPQDFSSVAAEIKSSLKSKGPKKLVISILAGVPVKRLQKAFGPQVSVIRTMPNLGAQVGESVTALTGASGQAMREAESLFTCCGKTLRLSEKYFDLVTAVSGSGPAYFFLMMELLSKAAQKAGLSASDAKLLAVQTAVGAAKLAQTSSEAPAVLRERVTSKKGTTDAALSFLFSKQFDRIFIAAVEKARKRSRELSKI